MESASQIVEECADSLINIAGTHPEITEVGQAAVGFLVSHYLRDERSLVRRHLNIELQNSTGDAQQQLVDQWLDRFDRATKDWLSNS